MIYLIYLVSLAIGGFCIYSAVLKLKRDAHMVDELKKMGIPYGFAYFSAAVEMLFAPVLIAGFWFPGIAGIAAIVLAGLMVGAAIANGYGRDAQHAIGVLVIFALPLAGVALYYWPQARTLVGV